MAKFYTNIDLNGNKLNGAVLENIDITFVTDHYESNGGYPGQFAQSNGNPYYCTTKDPITGKYIWQKLEANSGGETGVDSITLNTSSSNNLGNVMTGAINIGILKDETSGALDSLGNDNGNKLPTSKTVWNAINGIDLSSKDVTISKTTPTGFHSRYTISQGGTALSPTIDIPESQEQTDYTVELQSTSSAHGSTTYTLYQGNPQTSVGSFTIPASSSILNIIDYGPIVSEGDFEINNIGVAIVINIPDNSEPQNIELSKYNTGTTQWDNYTTFTSSVSQGTLTINVQHSGKFRCKYRIGNHYIKIITTDSTPVFILDRVVVSSELWGPVVEYPRIIGDGQERFIRIPYYHSNYINVIVNIDGSLASNYRVSTIADDIMTIEFDQAPSSGLAVDIIAYSGETYLIQHISDGSIIKTLIGKSQPTSTVYSEFTVDPVHYDYYTVTHNLNTKNIIVSVYERNKGELIMCDVYVIDLNSVKLVFSNITGLQLDVRVVIEGSYVPYEGTTTLHPITT